MVVETLSQLPDLQQNAQPQIEDAVVRAPKLSPAVRRWGMACRMSCVNGGTQWLIFLVYRSEEGAWIGVVPRYRKYSICGALSAKEVASGA